MAILIKLSTSLRGYVAGYDPHTGLEVDMPPGLTAGEVLARIGVPPEKVKIVMVNGLSTNLDQKVKDGDRIGVFPPVGGG